MRHLYTTLTLLAFILLSGANCHNRGMDIPIIAVDENETTWDEIRANSDAIDSALNVAFSELCAKPPKNKKRKPARIRLENPGTGPDTISVNQNVQNYE